MALASDIIKRAYRETNLIPLGQSPTTNQQTEALELLNTLVLSTVGNEVGERLTDVNIGGSYDQSSVTTTWVPDNSRLLLSLTSAVTYTLDPYPTDGQRFAILDIAGNLATYNITINPNGRKIEGASTLVLNTNSDAKEWMYRADTGNWVRITSLIAGDTMPFPTEFDGYFVTMLAMRINPRFSQSMTPESIQALTRQRSQIRARYNARREIQPDIDTRGYLSDTGTTGILRNTSDFNTGNPFPYR